MQEGLNHYIERYIPIVDLGWAIQGTWGVANFGVFLVPNVLVFSEGHIDVIFPFHINHLPGQGRKGGFCAVFKEAAFRV